MIPTIAKPTSNSFNFPTISQQSSFIPAIFLSTTNPNLCKYSSNRLVVTAIRRNDNIPTGSRDSRWSLQGMTALVTGGTRGIGFFLSRLLFDSVPISSLIVKFISSSCIVESFDFVGSQFSFFVFLGEFCRHAIVEELVGFGARVHTCARNEGELDNCLKGWENQGFKVTGSVCDVSSREQRERLLDSVSSVFNGKLNILVNNVGTNIRKPMVEFTPEEFSTLMVTNFESVFNLSQLAYPLLKASGCGSVVFMSSVSGFVSLKSMSAQGATKGAINQLTRNLACEWAKDNIRSNAVAPWYIKTSLVEKVLSNEEFLEEVYSRTPLRRLGDPKEVSSLVAFLCLPAAAYITGQVICIDGGMSINGFYPRIDFQ